MAGAACGYTLADCEDDVARSVEAWGTDFSYTIRVRWVHPGYTRRGYATAAVAAVVTEAFRMGATHVEIVHDLANVASGSIPRRPGFTEIERRPPQEERNSAEAGLDVVWRLWAPGHPE